MHPPAAGHHQSSLKSSFKPHMNLVLLEVAMVLRQTSLPPIPDQTPEMAQDLGAGDTLEVEEFDPHVVPEPPAPKRKWGQPCKTQPVTAAMPTIATSHTTTSTRFDDNDATFDLTAHVAQPDQLVRVQGKCGARRTKPTKVEPIGF
ncbi:hypothetical protein V5O48_005576 [Marasmius crinis-equi]|uniref:Uncharacterized protein n=1 Tax=Marasmius crinis-equi TaxID=585013 RepID=A0ABR3FLX4_9AGAR